LTETAEFRFPTLLDPLDCSLPLINAGVTLPSEARAVEGRSDRARFEGESGAGRAFAIAGASTGGSADDFSDFSGFLDVSDDDLIGVLGLGFDGGAFGSRSNFGRVEAGNLDEIELSGCLTSTLLLKELKVLVGDVDLGDSSCVSAFAFMSGTSCKNCDRLFMSSLRGDVGCDIEFSTSVPGEESLAGTATLTEV
jgi:hypothetical protein